MNRILRSVGQYKQLNIYVNGVPKGEDRKLGIKIHKNNS